MIENVDGTVLDKDSFEPELVEKNPENFATHFWLTF